MGREALHLSLTDGVRKISLVDSSCEHSMGSSNLVRLGKKHQHLELKSKPHHETVLVSVPVLTDGARKWSPSPFGFRVNSGLPGCQAKQSIKLTIKQSYEFGG